MGRYAAQQGRESLGLEADVPLGIGGLQLNEVEQPMQSQRPAMSRRSDLSQKAFHPSPWRLYHPLVGALRDTTGQESAGLGG